MVLVNEMTQQAVNTALLSLSKEIQDQIRDLKQEVAELKEIIIDEQ